METSCGCGKEKTKGEKCHWCSTKVVNIIDVDVEEIGNPETGHFFDEVAWGHVLRE